MLPEVSTAVLSSLTYIHSWVIVRASKTSVFLCNGFRSSVSSLAKSHKVRIANQCTVHSIQGTLLFNVSERRTKFAAGNQATAAAEATEKKTEVCCLSLQLEEGELHCCIYAKHPDFKVDNNTICIYIYYLWVIY